MSPYISLFFDVVIFITLGATIFYALRLAKQFNKLQADRQAFDTLIQSMNLAASRAEAAIRSLKETAIDTGDTLQEKVNTARALADELEIMIQAGDHLADRLQKVAETSRKAATSAGVENDDPMPEKKRATGGGDNALRSRAEQELINALKEKNKA